MSDLADVLQLPGHASFSQVSSYAQCGERYRLERLVGVEQQPQGHFIGGSAVHTCLEHACNTGESPDDLGAMFAEQMVRGVDEAGGETAVRWGGRKSKNYPSGESLAWWLTEGPKMLARGGEVLRAWAADGWQIRHVEDEFVFSAEKPVKARPDVVLYHEPTSTWQIVDWKTGVMKPATGGVQLAVYAMALREVYSEDLDVIGSVVMLRKDGDDRVIAYDPAHYEPVAVRAIRDFVAGTTEGIFPLNPGALCSACSVRAYCDFGKTLTSTEEE